MMASNNKGIEAEDNSQIDSTKEIQIKLDKKTNNGIVYSLYWYLSMWNAKFLKLIGVGPNAISIASLLVYILAGWCFYTSGYTMNIGGGVIVFFGILLDCTDGKLARMTNKSSYLGIWLDYNIDYVRYLFLYPPIALAILRDTNDTNALVYAFVIIVTILCSTIIGMRWNLFPFAKSFKSDLTKSKIHIIAKQFYAIAEIEPFVIVFFALMDRMLEFLLIWSVWNTFYFMGSSIMYGIKAHKEDIKARQKKE